MALVVFLQEDEDVPRLNRNLKIFCETAPRTAIVYEVYSIQTGVSLNQGYYIKESQSLSKHAFIEIVNITKVHRQT